MDGVKLVVTGGCNSDTIMMFEFVRERSKIHRLDPQCCVWFQRPEANTS